MAATIRETTVTQGESAAAVDDLWPSEAGLTLRLRRRRGRVRGVYLLNARRTRRIRPAR